MAEPNALTATQLDIKARNENLPLYMKRSIDTWRVAMGMVPLWGLDARCDPGQHLSVMTRRARNRAAQHRCRARKNALKGHANG